MENLIKALQILLKYGNPDYPTHCEHDILYICGIDTALITVEDLEELDSLGFIIDLEEDDIFSYRYGSC